MRTALLHIYDYFHSHRLPLWVGMAVVCVLLAAGAATLRYQEDISDFLPRDDDYRATMAAYDRASNANRIVVIFEGDEVDRLCEAVDAFAEQAQAYGLQEEYLTTEADVDAFVRRLQFVHAHAPLFLTDSDYVRMDSVFTPQGFGQALARDKALLSMPGSGLISQALRSDPLQLFPLSMGASGQYAGASQVFAAHDGYMTTADGKMAFCFYDSPYGSTESGRNGLLVDSLQHVVDEATAGSCSVRARLIGAPVVAVANARCIKRDSMVVIGLSVVLITLLLLYSFPRKRDIVLIMLSVGFGWLCGMALLRLVAGEVSVIVLGIGSVIIGLAVNYPLHLLVHQRYTTSVRQTLEEVLSPLLIGNITTVGAFMALLPIGATALRHFGQFAAGMLLGTIGFCIVVLPHLMSAEPSPLRELRLPKMAGLGQSTGRWMPLAATLITLAFAVVLLLPNATPRFDSNLSHINYMTDGQRADFALFERLAGNDARPAYTASTARAELERRCALWNEWWADKDREALMRAFRSAATEAGFAPNAFAAFEAQMAAPPTIPDDLAPVWPGRFDTEAMNRRVATSLSDHFDYLGIVCSAIVFVFLVLSFRSLWLALIAFLPMAVAWIWILGIMQIGGLQFNIVNIILATFLFGQGDDYTIFVLEGALYERRTGKPMLPQFGQSILLSALIMLISLGVLLIARHPAMHSLGVVTLIGMLCVVMMAWILPPALLCLWDNRPSNNRKNHSSETYETNHHSSR